MGRVTEGAWHVTPGYSSILDRVSFAGAHAHLKLMCQLPSLCREMQHNARFSARCSTQRGYAIASI